MFNAFALFRSLLIYGICLPLAIFLGYLVANPEDMTNDAVVGMVLGVLLLPLLLRWHHPMLVLVWNMVAVVFFLPGKPAFWLPVTAASFTISLLQYIVNRRNSFISVPSLAWPLLSLGGVVLLTSQVTGGIGLRVAGGDSIGGRRYVWIFLSIIGFFALTAKRIPMERAFAYVRMYFLSAVTAVIGTLAAVISPSLFFVFLVFPPDMEVLSSASASFSTNPNDMQRLSGLAVAGPSIALTMLALYGIRGIFEPSKFWRLLFFILCCVMSLFGGFRSSLILIIVVFGTQFYLEGLFRSRLLPVLGLAVLLGGAAILPFANHLPLAVQRSLSFLPVQIDQYTASDAQGSIDWRLNMWERTIPEVPKYLFIGKGYAINSADLEMIQGKMTAGADRFEGAYLAGDYHSGPLSVVMPFGIWGVITFTWLLIAGYRAMYHNYLFSSPELKNINTLFFAYYITKIFFFIFIFGSLYSDILSFVGLLGMSVAINGGILEPAAAPAPAPALNKLKLITVAR